MRNVLCRCVARLALAAGAMGVGGCLERYESITISPDGAAVLRTEFKGDIADMNAGDAVPGPGGPWLVSDAVDREDEKKATRRVELNVAAGGAFPSNYLAVQNDPSADRVLSFPTTLKVMRAGDQGLSRTYYDFKRTYQRRDDARYTLAQRMLEKDEALKALKDKKPEEWSKEDRVAVVRALMEIELSKFEQYTDAGIEAAGEDWPQEIGLLVRGSLRLRPEALEPRLLVELLGQPQSAERDASISEAMGIVAEGLRRTVTIRMEALGLSKKSQAKFVSAVEAEADRRGVTEDLGDEKWEVRVTLPGVVVAHNGDRVEGSTVVWAFGPESMMDMEKVLMASSRVDSK